MPLLIAQCLLHIRANYTTSCVSPHILYSRLLEKLILLLSHATIENALVEPESATKQFSAEALFHIHKEDHYTGMQIAKRFFVSESHDLHAAVGSAFSSPEVWQQGNIDGELSLIKELLASTND